MRAAILDLYRHRVEAWAGSPDPDYRGVHGTVLWFAKTLADFEINNIAAALPPLFCYNSQPCFDSSACASERGFASCAPVSFIVGRFGRNLPAPTKRDCEGKLRKYMTRPSVRIQGFTPITTPTPWANDDN